MCMSPDALGALMPQKKKPAEETGIPERAVDVPLGDGLANQARLSLLERRRNLDRAIGSSEQ